MVKLKWDQTGERLYETGTKRGVLYVQQEGAYPTGVAWNGLTAVRQSPDGAEETPLYADDIKYLAMYSAENFKGTIEAYTYPDEFAECDGSKELTLGLFVGQQNRKAFGMSYITTIGNDTMGNSYGEKLHVIYNAKVSPSERSYETINDTPNAITFSWEFATTPVDIDIDDVLPSAYFVIDSTKMSAAQYKAVKDALHGTEEVAAKLPTPEKLIALATAGV